MTDEGSTIAPLRGAARSSADLALELVSHVVLIGTVLAAAAGLMGVSTATSSAATEGLSLSVTYAKTTRAGLATPFELFVAARDGAPLPASLTLAVNSDYLAMFDRNNVDPAPDRTHVSGPETRFSFDVPEGASSLRIVFDARTQPDVRWGRDATVQVEGGPGLTFRTRVLP